MDTSRLNWTYIRDLEDVLGVLFKSVLKNFSKFSSNTCSRVSFLIRFQAWACNLTKKETLILHNTSGVFWTSYTLSMYALCPGGFVLLFNFTFFTISIFTRVFYIIVFYRYLHNTLLVNKIRLVGKVLENGLVQLSFLAAWDRFLLTLCIPSCKLEKLPEDLQ